MCRVGRHPDETSHYPSILCCCSRCARMTLIESDFCYSPLVSNSSFFLDSLLIYQQFLTITNALVLEFSFVCVFFRFLNTYDYYQSSGKKNTARLERINRSLIVFPDVFYWKKNHAERVGEHPDYRTPIWIVSHKTLSQIYAEREFEGNERWCIELCSLFFQDYANKNSDTTTTTTMLSCQQQDIGVSVLSSIKTIYHNCCWRSMNGIGQIIQGEKIICINLFI